MLRGEKSIPDYDFIYKPIPEALSKGCHIFVWLPKAENRKAGPLPVAIFIHGGGFTTECAFDIPFNQLNQYLDNGIAAVSLEYRLLPHVNIKDQQQDILDGYVYIQSKLTSALQEAGEDVKIDGTRTNVQGDSAGGWLTLSLSADIIAYNTLSPESPLPLPKANMVMYPGTSVTNRNEPKEKYYEFLKTLPEEDQVIGKKVFEEAVCTSFPHVDWVPNSPHPRMRFLMYALMSNTLNTFLVGSNPPHPPNIGPIDRLSSKFPPTCLIIAAADKLLDPQISYDLSKKLRELGVETHNFVGEDMPHGILTHHANEWPGYEKDSGELKDLGKKWWDETVLPANKWVIERT